MSVKGFTNFKRSAFGFTLAELLIALAILGVIATFTIPKILQAQQDGRYKAIAKEVAATVSGAYSSYKLNNTVTSGLQFSALTPYLNYVRIDTASNLDNIPTISPGNCNPIDPCYILHNGATLWLWQGPTLGGTGTTNAFYFTVDPDGTTTTGKMNSVGMFLYYSGRITSYAGVTPNTVNSSGGPYMPDPTLDPPWFNWN